MMARSPLLAPFLGLLAGVPMDAAAEPWTCRMTVQCETFDCSAIDDTYQIIAADHAGDLFLTSPAGDRPVTRLNTGNAATSAYASAGPDVIGELLTISRDGQALMSIHGSDAPARTITIFGTCRAL